VRIFTLLYRRFVIGSLRLEVALIRPGAWGGAVDRLKTCDTAD